MNKVKLFPGDIATVGGARIQVDTTVTVTTDSPIKREGHPRLTDLPETDLRIDDLWTRNGHRASMELQHRLRCPCGSAYTNLSQTHLSCFVCKRVWEKKDVPTTA